MMRKTSLIFLGAIAGAGLWRRIATVILPLAAPAIAAGALLVFLIALNELTVSALLWSAGLFSPTLRELRTTRYQFVHPFVIDSSVTERTFGLAPTDLDTVLKRVTGP